MNGEELLEELHTAESSDGEELYQLTHELLDLRAGVMLI